MSKFLLPFREGKSRLQTVSPTATFVSALCIGAIASIQIDLRVVVIMIIALMVGGTVTRTHWRLVLSLALRFELIVLLWVLLEPFLFGTTVLLSIQTPWGAANVYLEGAAMGAVIGLRMFFLVTLFTAVLSHMSLSEFVGALRSLHIPVTVLGSLLIMLHYIPLFMSERNRMQEALSLRGFERGERSSRVRSLGYTAGSMIDRAFSRSRIVYESMSLRGFGRGMMVVGVGLRRGDTYLALVVVLVLLGLLLGVPWFLEVMWV